MVLTDRFFVVTGGPGAGKSTLVQALAAAGMHSVAEAGRAVIQNQVAHGGTALPWADRQAFARRMLEHDVQSYRRARKLAGPVVFDRGVPDVFAYLKLSGEPVPRSIERAAGVLRYHHRIFLAPPWRAIFCQDAERKQTFEEAEATYRVLRDVYSGLGYELVDLPLASVAERVRFVREITG